MAKFATAGSVRARMRAALGSLCADGTVLLASIFLVAGATGIWVKKAQLSLSTGYLTIARFLGYSHDSELAWWQKLSFLRVDILLLLVVIPAAAALLLRFMPRRSRAPIAGIVAVAMCALFFFELQALGSIGRYLTPHLIIDALSWAADFPETVGEYVSLRGAVKLIAAVLVIVTLAIAAARRSSGKPANRLLRLTEAGTLMTLAGSTVFALIAALAPVPTLTSHDSMLSNIRQALLPGRAVLEMPDGASREDLLALFRRATRQTGGLSVTESAGLDAGHDVIVFIMETGPARSYDPIAERGSLPGISALLDRSFVARRHYTTYPYTSDAVFSILTGMYPIGRGAFLRGGQPMSGSGLIPPLQDAGYQGAAYLPYPDTFENDAAMYKVAGISAVYVANDTGERRARAEKRAARTIAALPAGSPARNLRGALLEDRLIHDYMALDAMIADIVANKRAGKRFAALFLPQIGHAPWFDLYGKKSVVERGRDLMILQDAWLAEVETVLAEHGWLDETVIVVTADHGIRTRVEDPELPSGTITGYSYHVPLVVFAPGTLTATREIVAPTSHIDIAPTVHALIGVGGGMIRNSGVPIWNNVALAERRVFLLGAGYLGADGYIEDGRFVVRRSLNGFVYQGRTFPVDHGAIVTETDVAAQLAEPIDLLYVVQPAVLELLHSSVPP